MNRYFTCDGDRGKSLGGRRVVVFFNGEDRGRSHWPTDGSIPSLGVGWSLDEMQSGFTEVHEQKARFILGHLPTKEVA